MLSWFKSASRNRATARELYGAVVAQSRRPEFYRDLCVPDTPEGRFEVIVLHLVLLLERLNAEGPAGRALGQIVSETFVTDMDDNMREMGVGDLTVPRKVKRAAAGLFERALAYRLALQPQAEPAALTALLAGLVGGEAAAPQAADALAGYVRRAVSALAAAPPASLLSGRVAFVPIDQ